MCTFEYCGDGPQTARNPAAGEAPTVLPDWLDPAPWLETARGADESDVLRALACDEPDVREFAALISPTAGFLLEAMAGKAAALTRRHFGNTISLYVPLYLSNYCSGGCAYCGFASDRRHPRSKLSAAEAEVEIKALKAKGFEEVLLLTGERTALNFVQRLSGIATLTNRFVKAVGDHTTKILDTRKTTPGLRALEKYAVRMGGGQNHRFGLYDRIMIKDNHRALAAFQGPDPIPWAVKTCRKAYPGLEIEVEAEDMDQVEAAAKTGADYILLDNMANDEIAEAVRIVRGRALLEASGGITLERISALAAIGVDFISVGALTHSARAIDIGLDIATPQETGPG